MNSCKATQMNANAAKLINKHRNIWKVWNKHPTHGVIDLFITGPCRQVWDIHVGSGGWDGGCQGVWDGSYWLDFGEGVATHSRLRGVGRHLATSIHVWIFVYVCCLFHDIWTFTYNVQDFTKCVVISCTIFVRYMLQNSRCVFLFDVPRRRRHADWAHQAHK